MKFKHYFYFKNLRSFSFIALIAMMLLSKQINAQNIDSLKIEIKNSTSSKQKAEIYNDLSNIYLDIDLTKSRKYVDSAIALGTEINDFSVLSNAYVNYANAFYFESNLDSMLFYYQKSYHEIIKTNNKNEIAASLNRMGLVYDAKSNYSKATQYYYEALKIYEEANYKPGLANVYNNLANINDALGNSEKSIENYTAALDIFLEINDLDGQANVYNNLATLYAEKNELVKAISYIKTAIKILRKTNRKSGTAAAYFNASTLYEKIGYNDSARYTLDSAYLYYTFTNNLHGIANVLSKEATILSKQQKHQEAIGLLSESLSLRKKVGSLSATAETIKQLSDAYNSYGDYEKSLQYFKNYTEIVDSILSENTKKTISELNIKYETAEKNKAIDSLQKKTEIKQFQNKFLIYLSVAFGIITLLLLYSFRTKSKFVKSQKEFIKQREVLAKLEIEKQQTEKILLENEIKVQQKINDLQKNELEHSKRELATSTLQILNKNKILSEIKETLEKIKPNNSEVKEVVKNVSKKVKDNINLDEDWEQFKMHFEKVNIGFFEKLQKQHPELSAGDLKVCAYIKINLSSKEIAQIMNISIDGINKRLYRIRKKINLSTENKLSAYLAEF